MTFDTEKLIREVKKRKAIWKSSSPEYGDRDLKRREWEEITNIMCEEDLPEIEKNEFGQSLQRKWKNIRTSFSRELKRRAGAKTGSAALRKSPYVYFDQLLFLKDTALSNASRTSVEESSSPPVVRKKRKTEDNSLIEVLKQNISMTDERERNRESDSDRLFILSLLEDFRKIPQNSKLSTKVEMINLIKRAQMTPETQACSNYEAGTSAAGPSSCRYGPEPFNNCQYHHDYCTQENYASSDHNSSSQYRNSFSRHENYGSQTSSSRQSGNVNSPPVSRSPKIELEYDEVLSQTGSDSTVLTENSEILDLFD